MKRPASQFYWADHFRDPGVRASTPAARGLWWDMLCMMHEGVPYGHLTVGGVKVSDVQLARMAGESLSVTTQLLKELEDNGVFSRTDTGVIYCRRMVRDERKRSLHAEAGRMGGNPKLTEGKKVRDKPEVKPRDKLTIENPGNQKLTPSSSSSTSRSTTPDAGAPERIYAFMGEMRPVWETAYGGPIPPGAAKRLKPLVDQFGSREVATRLANYLASTDAQFASIPRFVSTYGSWDSAKQNGSHRAGESVKRGYV